MMEQYYFMALFFLVGYAIGKVSMVKSLLGMKTENDKLKRDLVVLRDHIVSTKKGRIVVQGKDK